MKKAVIYGRVSTQGQDGDRQKTSLEEYAKRNGYEVVKYFAEKTTGASKAYERKEFGNLLKFIKEQDIKMILVDEVSRVGRLGGETRMEIEDLAKSGVNMYFQKTGKNTLKENGKIDYDTMLIIGIQADLAKREWDDTSYRIKNKLRESARSGKIQGGKFKAYGFTGDENNNILVREDEFKVVKKIFEMFDKGYTTNNITAWLNQNSIPTRYHDFAGSELRGKKAESYSWTDRTVQRVLRNRMWIGERWHLGELMHKSKAILDVDMFNRVQIKLDTRANKKIKVVKNTNYLKGIIKCACGSGMFMNIDPKKGNKTYTCNTRTLSKVHKTEYCGNPSVNIDKLYNTLHSVLTEKYINKQKGKPDIDFDSKIDAKKIELSSKEKSLKKNSTKLANLYEDYNERLISKAVYLSMKEKLEKELETFTADIEILKGEINTLHNAKNKPLLSFYTKDMFLNEARNILQSVTIGRASSKDEKVIKKTEQDLGISVSTVTVTGRSFGWVLSKFSKNYLLDGVLKPIEIEVKSLTVGDLHIVMKKSKKKKLKAAA